MGSENKEDCASENGNNLLETNADCVCEVQK
jgi:hypothetical protein